MRIEWFVQMCVFRFNYDVFCQKNQKILNVGKIRKYDKERVFFEKRRFSSFKIASLQNWESAKYFGSSRPSG